MSLMASIGSKWVIFGENVQNWVILGPKRRHMSKFWEICQIILLLKVSKNYFSQVYGHKFDQ